jgi:DNA repair exonuclease SbcCD ATPase subunit
MATHAKITSTDALEIFRSSLIVFLNKAQSALDQASDEIRRTRSWIQNDQRTHWENEHRRRARALQQAEQELLSARMTKALDNLSTQQAAVHKAKHALEEAEEKVRKVKLWMRDFDATVEPMAKGLNSLRGYLDHDLPRGIAYITEVEKIMESYTEAPRTAANPAEAPGAEIPAEEPAPAEPL